MLTSAKTIEKMARLEATYHRLIYEPVATLACEYLETQDHFRQVPGPAAPWQPCPSGTVWGQAWGSAWFRARFQVPKEFAPCPVYLAARTGAVEAMLWREGRPAGIFNYDPFVRNRGDHRAQWLAGTGAVGRELEVAVEGYAGHPTPGSQPFDRLETQGTYPWPCVRTFAALELCRRHEEINTFVLDLRTLNQLVAALPPNSFRRGAIVAGLAKVFALVPQDPANAEPAEWLAALAEAEAIMQPLLACRNGGAAPLAGLVGHSHLDTAWHWTRNEGIRKAARTYANALDLMARYPDYRFLQSSALHADHLRRHYPALFAELQQRVREGRWEPNGGVWVEPDVNLAGGEALVRQFLYGQNFTRRHFGYTADTFWLPDSFGYSAVLPQLLRGCGIRYFATTKLSWHERNAFPFDTFWWEGLDGSRVLAHFPEIHCAPDPQTLLAKLHGSGEGKPGENSVRHKDLCNMRLIAYGFGDGGGGPDAQMIEMAQRCQDLDGCPRAEHMAVGDFMKQLAAAATAAPVFRGELYFEGHRGTLTQMHEIKWRNRRAELALREAEFALVLASMAVPPSGHELWELLLANQFHDILPGTSIAEVHDQAISELGQVIAGATALARQAAQTLVAENGTESITLLNSLSWTRNEARLTGVPAGTELAGSAIVCQEVNTPWGENCLDVAGLALRPLGMQTFRLQPSAGAGRSEDFEWDGQCLRTPWLVAHFDVAGGLASLVDRHGGRELRAPGELPLNTLLFGEDVPGAWDNWDIDRDLALKLKPLPPPAERTVSGRGPLAFRIRQVWRFGQGSRLVQDTVFSSRSPRVDFETLIEWHEKHRFLATVFPLNIRASQARHEVQFGHVERPTHRNFAEDQERFEAVQHKWTDLSENRYGVALLNDSKYGVNCEGKVLRLSLHKGGTHPDPRGDAGRHRCTYSLLPHSGGFLAETVVRPAYELNIPPTWIRGETQVPATSLFTLDAPNVIVETAKPAEEGQGYVLRLYECERQACRARLCFGHAPHGVELANLLEESQGPLTLHNGCLELEFGAFEIKTLIVRTSPAKTFSGSR